MLEFYEPSLTPPLRVREFTKPQFPFLTFQIGEYRKVHRTAPPQGRTLPVGYAMDVQVFHLLGYGRTLADAKNKLPKSFQTAAVKPSKLNGFGLF